MPSRIGTMASTLSKTRLASVVAWARTRDGNSSNETASRRRMSASSDLLGGRTVGQLVERQVQDRVTPPIPKDEVPPLPLEDRGARVLPGWAKEAPLPGGDARPPPGIGGRPRRFLL